VNVKNEIPSGRMISPARHCVPATAFTLSRKKLAYL
jgi:hypothetical protein